MWETIKTKLNSINWLVRLKNPTYLWSVALAIATPIFAYYGVAGADLTTWGSVFALLLAAISNPYVVVTIGVSIYNATLDPTTAGISDSENALTYTEPN